ncbi:hypothetical protein ZIOFF_072649 [Zingiber officinale]|uniref:Uncharacterized protein n=1 Tax=Zingiber officinale TaxID=94328 RepID=A0A8J5BW27_ZINOF|nr:hypothetical protein ZIOFF_072649 [Zingiber officinale]
MATTKTEQQQVATTPLFEDQIRSYRRNQRRLYNTQQAARRLGRQLIGGTSSRYTLEQQLEPEAQLQLSMQERASIVPAEVLYHSRRDDAHHRVYVHRSEEVILVTDNHQVDRSFIQEESFMQLQRSHMQYIHLGVLQVCVQILHRQHEGTMTLIVLRDNRWQGDQAILATMEVDLTRGSQMIYVIQEVMMTIGDFYRNIQISILTRGYEAWQNSEANLLITRGMVGRLSNTPNVGFAYEVQGVVDYLTSHGVNALPGRRFSIRNLQDSEGRTALHWAVDRGHLDAVKTLLDNDAHVNAKDDEGQTPLHYAALCEREEIAKLLVSRHADPSMKDNFDSSPLDLGPRWAFLTASS